MISTLESELITHRLSNEFLLDPQGNGRILLGWVIIFKNELHFLGLGFAEASGGSNNSNKKTVSVVWRCSLSVSARNNHGVGLRRVNKLKITCLCFFERSVCVFKLKLTVGEASGGSDFLKKHASAACLSRQPGHLRKSPVHLLGRVS